MRDVDYYETLLKQIIVVGNDPDKKYNVDSSSRMKELVDNLVELAYRGLRKDPFIMTPEEAEIALDEYESSGEYDYVVRLRQENDRLHEQLELLRSEYKQIVPYLYAHGWFRGEQ